MSLKSIHCLSHLKRVWFNTNRRLFSTFNEIQINSNDLYTNSKSKKIVSLLREYDFNDRQIESIFKSIGKYITEDNGLDDKLMRDTIDCWQSHVKPPRLRANQLDKLNAEDIDYDMSVDFNHVISKIEPKLLLINSNAIIHRINCIKGLSIIGGSRDLWRVFVYAPNGYYLQSWTDFLKKYHYLNFGVLQWLLDKNTQDLHPHPLIRCSRVMEMPFETIRCRYLFAKRTGLKSLNITNNLSNIENTNKIDLKTLLLTPIDKYLKFVAPNCSSEEYLALESLLNEMPVEEDEQIIEDMISLTASHNKNPKKVANNLKADENCLQNNYQIISKIE